MFGLNPGTGKASENFYRNVFSLVVFISFAIAILTDSPVFFAAVLIFGTLSRIAVKKSWKNPKFAERIPWIVKHSENSKNT
ncbi:MAG: hypothetical protein LBK91_05690 [Synergistaceae bacterium]|nr:hypothetical protein [Synergistaceae bacterium]